MGVNPQTLIENGLAIFPTDPGDKRPVARDKRQHPVNPKWDYVVPRISWGKEATTDPEQIARWIADYPGCNWGVPTGLLNGLIAVDVDSDEALAWWEEKWLPDGKRIATPRGGVHILYSIEDLDVDIQTNVSKIIKNIDVRGEGGYIVAYSDDLIDIPELPESVLEILPERQEYVTVVPEEIETVLDVSEAEKRVLRAITDSLDALPRPWTPGAGYHNTQFMAACWLNRVANSPYYATTHEQAHALFVKHAPLRDKADAALRDQRWESATETTQGQMAEPPGDTPIRLEVTDELLSRFADSEIDTLFWESKKIGEVKRLIHALRLKGANEQEAYSISYDSAAMKHIRQANAGSSSTWGYVLKEYEQPITEKDVEIEEGWAAPVASVDSGVKIRLLSDEERSIIRDYPNYIDGYIDSAREIYSEPNLPLHYVNAWISLSIGIGDQGAIHERKGRIPLSLWGFNAAPTAAGKSDANKHMENAVNNVRRGGFAGVNLGSDASAEQLVEVVMDRGNKATGMFIDECKTFLQYSKQPGHYYNKLMDSCLKLYDGEASRALRKGMDKDQIGQTVDASFTLWLQGAWDRIISVMDESDIESGLVGRFLVAIGGGANITRESLTPDIASEFQVNNDGRHAIVDSFTNATRDLARSVGSNNRMDFASKDVIKRFVDAREVAIKYAETQPRAEHLRGIFLRVTYNILKGAALIALSEGRNLIEMEDMLLALKSGEYWLQGSLEMVEGISGSQYRRMVDAVVKLVHDRPRATSTLLKSPILRNLKQYEAMEIIDRAEKEGAIKKAANGRWEAVE